MHVNRQPSTTRRGGGTTHHRTNKNEESGDALFHPWASNCPSLDRCQNASASGKCTCTLYDISHFKGIDAPSTGQTWVLARDSWSSITEPRDEGSVD